MKRKFFAVEISKSVGALELRLIANMPTVKGAIANKQILRIPFFIKNSLVKESHNALNCDLSQSELESGRYLKIQFRQTNSTLFMANRF